MLVYGMVLAYVLMMVNSGSEGEVAKKIAEYEEVESVSIVYGEYDLIAKVRVKDLDDLDDFLTNKVRSLPQILLTTTMIVSKEYQAKHK